jgi:hypothetical protein
MDDQRTDRESSGSVIVDAWNGRVIGVALAIVFCIIAVPAYNACYDSTKALVGGRKMTRARAIDLDGNTVISRYFLSRLPDSEFLPEK